MRLAMLLLVVFLAACGGDSTGQDTSPDAGGDVTETGLDVIGPTECVPTGTGCGVCYESLDGDPEVSCWTPCPGEVEYVEPIIIDGEVVEGGDWICRLTDGRVSSCHGSDGDFILAACDPHVSPPLHRE